MPQLTGCWGSHKIHPLQILHLLCVGFFCSKCVSLSPPSKWVPIHFVLCTVRVRSSSYCRLCLLLFSSLTLSWWDLSSQSGHTDQTFQLVAALLLSSKSTKHILGPPGMQACIITATYLLERNFWGLYFVWVIPYGIHGMNVGWDPSQFLIPWTSWIPHGMRME